MNKKYIRAHPRSVLGENYTAAHRKGWVLVGFTYMYQESYPVFRESFWRWFKRAVLKIDDKHGGSD